MSWEVIFFDLDGTLTDSEPGVANGIVHALSSIGAPVPEKSELRKFLGPPLSYSFREFVGLSEPDVVRVTKIYRDYYHEIGRFENSVFAGMKELLDALSETGRPLAVATSKVEYSALSILEHFKLDGYFSTVVGADELGLHRGSKALVIEEALARMAIADPSSVVMIGDREHDVHGAAEHGMDCIGVLWGYGSERELMEAGVHHLVASPTELGTLLNVEFQHAI